MNDVSTAGPAGTGGVRLLSTSLPYADGAEHPLLDIMRAAQDRSSLSDELAGRISDWPTRYHLSRQRANLLRPLAFPAGARVLDVGAGTGALSRYLGEQGLRVVALEGSVDRARVAATRCDGLDDVEVVCGPVSELEDPDGFDVTLCVGVLEYATTRVGGQHGDAGEFLAHLWRLTADGGTLVLAIENQLGLKYLLGYPEDHLGRPWEGVEGYQGSSGVRTYSRRELAALLGDAGFTVDTWLYPYPDYKLPKVVLADAAFDLPDVATVVDHLVRQPAVDLHRGRTLLCDDRAAHRTFLAAGLGREVANSFVVVARKGAGGAGLVPEDTLAWHFGNDRRALWRQEKRLVSAPEGLVVRVRGADAVRERGWLRQRLGDDTPFVAGATLEQQVRQACGRKDLDALGEALGRWDEALRAEELPAASPPAPEHPFVRAATTTLLPPDHLDCNLDNFIAADDGGLVYVDREWSACAPVDARLVRLRALWYLASDLILGGAVLPWAPEVTVDELTRMLWRITRPGEPLTDDDAEALRAAEAALQHLVTGRAEDEELERITRQGEASRATGRTPRTLPFTRLRAEAERAGKLEGDVATLREQAKEQRAQLAAARARESELRAEQRRLTEVQRRLERREADLGREVAAAEQRLADLRRGTDDERARWRAEREQRGAELARHRDEVARLHTRVTALRAEQEQLRRVAGHAGEALRRRERQLQQLGEHTVALQRRVRSLLASRRWKIGEKIGNTVDRLAPGRRPSTEAAQLGEAVEQGFRMLRGVVPVKPIPVGPVPSLSAGQAAKARAEAEQAARVKTAPPRPAEPPFRAFGDFLAYATTCPLLETPFDEQDRRVLGVMDSRRRQLVARYRQRAQDMLVSVVMPTYNRREVLSSAIASVRAQTYGNWELLVVDDGSDDGTAEYVRGIEDPRVRLVELETNVGVSAARNAGLEEARGELVAYLDSDNTWHPEYLLVMVGMLADEAWAPAAYCAQEIWETSKDAQERTLKAVRFGPFNRALLENRNYVDLNAFVHRRAVTEELGGFDTTLPRLVDWELVLRYTTERGAVAVPCVLSRYEFGLADDQLTHTLPWQETLRKLLGAVRPEPLDLPVPHDGDEASRPRLFPVARPVAAPRYARGVTIVIPSFEVLEYLQLCIASVHAYTAHLDYRLVVVDNASSEPVRAWLRSVDHPRTEVVLNEANLGFTTAANMGAERARDGDDVILLNNDAVVTPGWVEAMWEVFDRVPDAGLVAPRQTLLPGTPTMDVHVPYGRADRELDVTLSRHHRNVLDPFLDPERGLVELEFAPFFCVYIPRETFETVGPLNAESGPHYRSDRLYCDMVRHFAGKRIVYTPHAKLYHFLQRATKQLKDKDPDLFKEMFVKNDWSGVRARQRGQTDAPGPSPTSERS